MKHQPSQMTTSNRNVCHNSDAELTFS